MNCYFLGGTTSDGFKTDFNDLEIEQIHVENNQLIITILTNDMLS